MGGGGEFIVNKYYEKKIYSFTNEAIHNKKNKLLYFVLSPLLYCFSYVNSTSFYRNGWLGRRMLPLKYHNNCYVVTFIYTTVCEIINAYLINDLWNILTVKMPFSQWPFTDNFMLFTKLYLVLYIKDNIWLT